MNKYNQSWHNDKCEHSLNDDHFDPYCGHKKFFCKTHNQWAAILPVETKIIYIYGDGSTKEITK